MIGKLFVNLTHYRLKVYDDDKETLLLDIMPSGMIATVYRQVGVIDTYDGIPVHALMESQAYGIPDSESNVIYITELSVRKAVLREDVIAYGEVINVQNGILSCVGFRLNN